MKVFSMLPSVAGSERAWSSMSFIHSKARNRLKTEKTQKLAYLHINLKLKMKNGYYTQNELDLAHLLNNAMMVDAEEEGLGRDFLFDDADGFEEYFSSDYEVPDSNEGDESFEEE
jgi:hypothetical protein